MKLLLVWTLAVLACCAHARTRATQPPISARITSLTDKDARQKASVHPAFANAGRQPGIEIWRIEDFEPVPVSQRDYGKFYKGDSYIVLKTKFDTRNNLSWDIHYWIGSQSTQDESGAAAILTVGLDDKFGGAAIQHRETMGYESAQFTGYFQPAIQYLDGGHATGFNHVTTNVGAEKRLLQVKGKRNVRVRQVDPLISSMNKGDCFILDVGNNVYLYVGANAKIVEKMKAISIANQIRDQDHNGRATVEIIDQYSSETDVQRFFTALGSGSRDLVPEESAGGDDQTFERNEEQSVILSEISDSTGSLKITPLTKPYRQNQLKAQECYILDTVSGSIYVWVGKQATDREKNEAMLKAQQYLSAKNYPSWVHVARIPQGTEPAIFKQYFTTWQDVGMSHTRIVRSLESTGQFAEPKLYKAILRSDYTVVFKPVTNFRQQDLQEDETHVLDTGDVVYVWLGSQVSKLAKKSVSYIGQEYQKSHNSESSETVAVKQGREPELFMANFAKWDPDMWIKQKYFTEVKTKTLLGNAISRK